MTPQKIFTINELVSHIKELEPAEVKLESISILFKVQCAVSKKNMFKKDVIFINPLNIKVNGSNKDDSKYTHRFDVSKWQEEFGDDFGIKFSLRKGMELVHGAELNMLKIDPTKYLYKGFIYYRYIIKGYIVTEDSSPFVQQFIKELIAAHKDDTPFKFRPKPQSEFGYLDDMAEEI